VGVTKEELVERFGGDVADLVAEVTDDKSLPKAERKRLQIENAPHKSVRAQQIKLADKISNLRAILASPPTAWDFQRKKEYFEWAKRVVDGLSAPNLVLKRSLTRRGADLMELLFRQLQISPSGPGGSVLSA
jgi:hypothetical protein